MGGWWGAGRGNGEREKGEKRGQRVKGGKRCGGGGGGWGGVFKQKEDERPRHPLVSPGTFLCTGNDCTRSRSGIWEEGGGGWVEGRCGFKQLNEKKEGARMHTWSARCS